MHILHDELIKMGQPTVNLERSLVLNATWQNLKHCLLDVPLQDEIEFGNVAHLASRLKPTTAPANVALRDWIMGQVQAKCI